MLSMCAEGCPSKLRLTRSLSARGVDGKTEPVTIHADAADHLFVRPEVWRSGCDWRPGIPHTQPRLPSRRARIWQVAQLTPLPLAAMATISACHSLWWGEPS